MNNQQKVLSALIEKPSRYHIEVIDNSMLSEELREKKEIEFVVRPPSMGVLAMCADEMQNIPKDFLMPGKQFTIQEIVPYIDNLIRCICRISHGKQNDYPLWYEPFMKGNLTPKEVYQIFHETSIKMQSDFFLNSFQIASLTNPMMMNQIKRKKKRKDSTPSS